MLRNVLAASALTLFAFSAPAFSHHSLAMYDTATQITLENVVVEEFEWTNPHCWLHVMMKDEAGVDRIWTIESNSTGQLINAGWSQDSAKAGDMVTIVINPLRDGTRGGRLEEIHHPDGRVFKRQGGGAYDPRTGELY